MYAITGITGQVGSQLAQRLLAAKLPVRAVLRDADKAVAWQEHGCEIALADMNDTAALARAFTGATGVFILLPPNFDPTPDFAQTRRIIASIREALAMARPERVVVISTVGAQATQTNLLSQLGLLEQSLRTLALPVTFLRPAWFMENAAWDIASARDTGTIAAFLQPVQRRIPMVATADIAALAATLLQETWHGARVVQLEGPHPVSPDDIAATLSSLLGREVHAEPVARDTWEALFKSQGMANPVPRMQMLDGFNQGWLSFDGDAREVRKGSTSLETVLQGLVAKTC
jgi:NAD(P)H dehydrogenase (quinone)